MACIGQYMLVQSMEHIRPNLECTKPHRYILQLEITTTWPTSQSTNSLFIGIRHFCRIKMRNHDMNKPILEESLMQNSTLSCFLLTSFVRSYEKLTIKTYSPELLKLLLILPIVWHKESCLAIKARSFSTPL